MKKVLDRLAAEEATADVTEYALVIGVVATIGVIAAAIISTDLEAFWRSAQAVLVAGLGTIPH
jgi:Flp pilus assembly pilin Flp